MQCTRCGLEQPQDARFCSRCGTAILAYQQQPAQASNPAPGSGPGTGYGPGYTPVYGPAVGGTGYGAGYVPGYGAGYGAGYGGAMAGGSYSYNRVARHVQTVGMLWAVYAIYRFVTKVLGMTLFHSWIRHSHGFGSWGGDWMGGFLPFALTSLLLSTTLAALAAYGLLTRQTWGRVIAIACAVWSLIHPVMGTVLGVYTLWALASATSGMEYDAMARPPAPKES
ncbi:hypothetical protein SAMN05421819_2171 [Bryocella elongata]|uniref:Uncharacterized protein n=1 Tax=Bryocella elongata TaxID=863522 RepID=A0A1H5Y9M2_9BACT|nr:zinc ribbon domain-containing protein [Bryocella elongata]SEG20166.1 hypothetical protein SAMN05421819_2171 [Bryocella elongata]